MKSCFSRRQTLTVPSLLPRQSQHLLLLLLLLDGLLFSQGSRGGPQTHKEFSKGAPRYSNLLHQLTTATDTSAAAAAHRHPSSSSSAETAATAAAAQTPPQQQQHRHCSSSSSTGTSAAGFWVSSSPAGGRREERDRETERDTEREQVCCCQGLPAAAQHRGSSFNYSWSMTVREAPAGVPVGAPRSGSPISHDGPKGPQGPLGGPSDSAGPPTFGLNLDSGVKGISVEIKGLQNVKPETVTQELRHFEGVRTVRDLLLAVETSQNRLSSLGLFSALASELHCGERDGDVEVTIHLKELRRSYTLGLNVNGRGQTEVEAAAHVPAVAGTNKTLSLAAAASPAGGGPSRSLTATLGAPRLPLLLQRLPGGPPLFSSGLLRIYTSQRDLSAFNSRPTSASGAAAQLSSADGAHVVSASWVLRNNSPLCCGERIASRAVMSLPWRSLKHSLSYTYTRDRLDTPQQTEANAAAAAETLLPRRGYKLQASAEAALPGGDARYLKAELRGYLATPLPPTCSSSSSSSSSRSSCSPWVLTARFGLGALLAPQGGPPVFIDDKFHFAGGASPLRGFRAYGVGPSDQAYTVDAGRSVCLPVRDYLGGDTFLATELCLAYDFDLPRRHNSSSSSCNRDFRGYHPRLFVFGSLGSLGDVFTQQQQQQQRGVCAGLASVFRQWRASVGVGLQFPLQRGAWLDFALASPLRRAETDEAERLQLGVRLTSAELGL